MKLLAAALALAALPGAASACGEALGPQARTLAGNGWQLAWRPAPEPIPLSRHFQLDIVLCPPAGELPPKALRVDATMPEHRHGMNYRPSVQAQGDGRFNAAGLLFHMSGRWELVFEWSDAAGQTRRLAQSVELS